MAVQALGIHDTPSNWLISRRGGLGVFWIFQWTPFHTSARVVSTNELCRKDPTAVQEVGDVHDTLYRLLPPIFMGLGTCWIVHVFPSHASEKLVFKTPE